MNPTREDQLHELQLRLDEAQRLWTSAVDVYCAGNSMTIQISQLARQQGERLPDWLVDNLGQQVKALFDAQQALHGDYEAALKARQEFVSENFNKPARAVEP